jgi:hypothetical protein
LTFDLQQLPHMHIPCSHEWSPMSPTCSEHAHADHDAKPEHEIRSGQKSKVNYLIVKGSKTSFYILKVGFFQKLITVVFTCRRPNI